MKITANGGTDAANIVLFWPDNLPDDADARLKDDPYELANRLREEGKLIWFLCDGDGGYTVAIYVRTELPDDLLALCGEKESYPTLVVRGDGYFGGMEYMFKHDSSFLEKHPAMCEKVQVPEGTYSAHVYRTDIPKGFYETWMRNQVGTGTKRLWELHGVLTACAVVGVLVCLVSVFFAAWQTWFFIVAATVVFILSAIALSRADRYKTAARANEEFGRAFPSFVVHLE